MDVAIKLHDLKQSPLLLVIEIQGMCFSLSVAMSVLKDEIEKAARKCRFVTNFMVNAITSSIVAWKDNLQENIQDHTH